MIPLACMMFKLLQNILSMRENEAFCTLVGLEISGKRLDDARRLKKSSVEPLVFMESKSMLKSPQTKTVLFPNG